MMSDPTNRPRDISADRARLRQVADISETLLNLIYLTQLEAERPEQVRKYMSLSEDRMRAMIEVLYQPQP